MSRYSQGESAVVAELVPLVYPALLAIARRQLAGESQRGELDTTALVHEAYLRLDPSTDPDWQNRSHFFAICARLMRQIIVDYARKRRAQKRGGGLRDLTLNPAHLAVIDQADQLVTLNDVLERLSEFNPRLTRVVECRFFAGMTEEETAVALRISRRTVQRDWLRARAWLRKEASGLEV